MTFAANPERVQTLLAMLAYKRPAGSKTERRFIKNFIEPLGVYRDPIGNLMKIVGPNDPTVLWSSHTDTVHRDGGMQSIAVHKGIARLSAKSKSNCLGADCTAGVWLMREMILASVPGLYIFHRSEERGGVGSDYVARTTPHIVEGINAAIAFDRRERSHVITHQAGGRCCSDTFANALAAGLGMAYAPNDGGTFTDTANYMDLVAECTNVSVGYFDEHSSRESLDVVHLCALLEALLKLDAGALPVERDPTVPEPIADHWRNAPFDWTDYGNSRADDLEQDLPRSLVALVKQYPDEVADVLEAYGLGVKDLADEILMRLHGGLN